MSEGRNGLLDVVRQHLADQGLPSPQAAKANPYRIYLRIPKNVAGRLKAVAAEMGISLNSLLSLILTACTSDGEITIRFEFSKAKKGENQ